MISLVLLVAALVLVELIYFRIAARYQIIDRPNERSSHVRPVIRGGGIIFIFVLWAWFSYSGFAWPYFILGATLVALISFLDDLFPQKAGVRFLFHLAGVLLLFFQAGLFTWPLWLVVLALIVCIGTINAFNFMDGINGITGIYSLVSVGTFWYINEYVSFFTDEAFLLALAASIFVFLFFNFRKRAKCFAGDVGSVTLAFAIIFLLLRLINATDNFVWVLFLLVYGTDSVMTIIYRLKNRENIFKAHRTHLYQFLTNEMKMPHLGISVLYGLLQLSINIVVISFFNKVDTMMLVFLGVFVVMYVIIREWILKRVGRPGLFMKAVTL